MKDFSVVNGLQTHLTKMKRKDSEENGVRPYGLCGCQPVNHSADLSAGWREHLWVWRLQCSASRWPPQEFILMTPTLPHTPSSKVDIGHKKNPATLLWLVRVHVLNTLQEASQECTEPSESLSSLLPQGFWGPSEQLANARELRQGGSGNLGHSESPGLPQPGSSLYSHKSMGSVPGAWYCFRAWSIRGI